MRLSLSLSSDVNDKVYAHAYHSEGRKCSELNQIPAQISYVHFDFSVLYNNAHRHSYTLCLCIFSYRLPKEMRGHHLIKSSTKPNEAIHAVRLMESADSDAEDFMPIIAPPGCWPFLRLFPSSNGIVMLLAGSKGPHLQLRLGYPPDLAKKASNRLVASAFASGFAELVGVCAGGD